MNFKKVISASVCSAMILSLVGCTTTPKDFFTNIIAGNQNNNGNQNVATISEEVNKNAVFKETSSFNLEGFEYIASFASANGKFYAIGMKYEYPEGEYNDPVLYEEPVEEESAPIDKIDVDEEDIAADTVDYEDSYDENYDPEIVGETKVSIIVATFTNESDVQYEEATWDSGEYPQGGVGVDSQGNFYIMFSSYDYETDTESYSFKKLSPSLEVIKEIPVGVNEEYYYVRDIYTDDNGDTFVISDESVEIYDKDLNKTGSFKPDSDGYISSASVNSENKLVVIYQIWTEEKSTTKCYVIDNKGNAKEDSNLSSMLSGRSVINGKGYDYYYRTSASVCAFNNGDKKATEVVNFYDSDIDPNSIYGDMYFLDAEHFLTAMSDYGTSTIVMYEKVPESEVKDKEIITLGTVYGSYSISKQILDFNKNNDSYRIKLLDYSEYNTPEDWNAGAKRFNTDLTSGSAPDIIVADSTNIQNLISKGVFTDLTPLMDNYNGLKKTDLVENARTLFADGDKLYCVYPSFYIQAVEVKKSNYVEGMSIEDIVEWEKKTGNKAFSEMTKEGVLSQLMSLGMDAFLDPKTGKCNFNSDEFAKILEYSNTYPLEFSDDYWENYDYSKYVNVYRNDQALLEFTYISNFRDYNWNRQYRFGEETVLMGAPIKGSSGATISVETPIGISSKCKNKEAAWEFVNTCFSEEYYEQNAWSLPTVESEMDKMIEKATERPYWEDENGKKEYYDETYWLIDHEEPVTPLTKEQAAKIKEFVVHVNNISTWDEELNNIVDEETQGYFEGQKSAKEVADVIQSRLQIYINEKK